MLNTTGAAHASRAPRFGVMLVLSALLAFAVREHYVLTAIVDQSDSWRHSRIRRLRVESRAARRVRQHDAANMPVADDYRLPGYPWLIALGMQLFPQEPTWARWEDGIPSCNRYRSCSARLPSCWSRCSRGTG